MEEAPIVSLAVDGISPIAGASIRFPPGVTILCEEDRKRRSTLVQCLRVALGSDELGALADDRGSTGDDRGPIGDDGGHLALSIGDSTVERAIDGASDENRVTGETYVDDVALADRYAFGRAPSVEDPATDHQEWLRDLLFAPTAVATKRREARRLGEAISEINQQLASIASTEAEHARLAERRESLDEHISTLDEQLERTETAIRGRDDARTTREVSPPGTEQRLADLRDARERFREVQHDIHATLETLADLAERRQSVGEELLELDEAADEGTAPDTDRLPSLRRERERRQRSIRQLQSVIELTSGLLEDGNPALLQDIADAVAAGTDEAPRSSTGGQSGDAVQPDELVCWACGSSVGRNRIEETVETLETLRGEKIAELNEIEERIEPLERDERNGDRTADRRQGLEEERAELDADIEEKREEVTALQRQRAALVSDVDAFDDDVRVDEAPAHEELLALERDANQLLFDVHRAETSWEEVTERANRLLEQLESREQLRAERSRKNERRATLREEIDRIEASVVERFNDELGALSARTPVESISSLEVVRRRSVDADGPDFDPAAVELRVAVDGRGEDDGAVPLEAVEGPERTVATLLARLAGYVVHDVHERVPFLLVDLPAPVAGPEAADLLSHLADFPTYLVVSAPRPRPLADAGDFHCVETT